MTSFRQITYGSNEYHQECALRDAVLRRPLGLSLSAEDRDRERDQLHFGLFGEDGALIGCVVAVPLSAHTARIRQMAVVHIAQGRGHGRHIMEALEADLARRGMTRLEMHARVSAVGFYRKLGYAPEGQVFTEVTIPHVAMARNIHP